MKILLEQVITGETETRITLIDSTIDTKLDAIRALEAIDAFDSMLMNAGVFTDNDHMQLEINGEDIGYAEINHWSDLITFLGGEVN